MNSKTRNILSALRIFSFVMAIGVEALDQTHGNKCDGVRLKCRTGLNCLDGKCECRYPKHQIYDSESTNCQSLARGPCDPSDRTRGCIPNANCITRIDGHKECQCNTGFIESAAGICEREFGSSCSGFQKCDSSVPLFCRNGVCDCKDELEIFDKDLRKCTAGFGAVCQNSDECYGGSFGNMICKVTGNKFGRGQCNCRYGISVNGVCQSLSGEPPASSTIANRWHSQYPTTTGRTSWRSHFDSTTTTTAYPKWSLSDTFTTRRPYPFIPRSTRRSIYEDYEPIITPSTPKPDLYYIRTTTTTTRRPRSYNGRPSASEEEAEWIAV